MEKEGARKMNFGFMAGPENTARLAKKPPFCEWFLDREAPTIARDVSGLPFS